MNILLLFLEHAEFVPAPGPLHGLSLVSGLSFLIFEQLALPPH